MAERQAETAAAQQQAAAAPEQAKIDGYLSRISPESLEVLQYFGPEAPAKLNAYANSIEDALLESLNTQGQQATALQEHIEWATKVVAILEAAELEREGFIRILTVPDLLAQYTEAFFSEDGPAPVQTPGDQARAALAQGLVQPDGNRLVPNQAAFAGMSDPRFEEALRAAMAEQQAMAQGEPQGQEIPLSAFQAAAQGGFGQRPAVPMPSPGGMTGPVDPASVWDAFRQADPTKAWQILDRAPAEALRAKILAMDT